VAWALVAVFLLQPLLAYLATPVLLHDTKGMSVVVCTLQGEKIINVDIPGLTDDGGTEHCPALKLYQLAGSVQITEPPLAPMRVLLMVHFLDQTAAHAHHLLHFSAYSTRAPPALS
jgi:hypothetical protein